MVRFYARKVQAKVGNNPIAQAVARKQVHDSILSTRINLHMLETGEPCGPLLDDMALLLRIMHLAAVSPTLRRDSQDGTLLGTAFDAVQVMSVDGAWDAHHLPVLDEALARADVLYQTTPASRINDAIKISGGQLT